MGVYRLCVTLAWQPVPSCLWGVTVRAIPMAPPPRFVWQAAIRRQSLPFNEWLCTKSQDSWGGNALGGGVSVLGGWRGGASPNSILASLPSHPLLWHPQQPLALSHPAFFFTLKFRLRAVSSARLVATPGGRLWLIHDSRGQILFPPSQFSKWMKESKAQNAE